MMFAATFCMGLGLICSLQCLGGGGDCVWQLTVHQYVSQSSLPVLRWEEIPADISVLKVSLKILYYRPPLMIIIINK